MRLTSWKSCLIFLFALFCVTGCLSDNPQLFSMKTNTIIFTFNPSPGTTNILFYGKSETGEHSFAKFLPPQSQSLELDLPSGDWTFYALSLSSSTFTGCDLVPVNNRKTKKFLTFDLQESECAHPVFLGPNPAINNSVLPSVSFGITKLEFCESLTGIFSSGDVCSDDLNTSTEPGRVQARGNPGSFRFTLREYSRTGDRYEFTNNDLADCIDVSPASLRGLSNSFIDSRSLAGDGSRTPFYSMLEVFPRSNCDGTPKVISLPNGFVSDTDTIRYVTEPGTPAYRKLYVKYSGEDVCQGDQLTATPFAGGFGTPNSPYLICTANQLWATIANPIRSFKLQKDIDLSARTVGAGGTHHPLWEGCVNAGTNWLPIGYTNGCSTVTTDNVQFDGGGKKITGLRIGKASIGVGFYRVLGVNGQVRRLTVESSVVTGNGNVGTIAGSSSVASIRMINLINPVVTSTSLRAGGLIGDSFGTLFENNTLSGIAITGTGYVGGITGVATRFTGVAPYLYKNFVAGTVTGSGNIVGGITGQLNGSGTVADIEESRFIGHVRGPSIVGGVAGNLREGRILNSYVNGLPSIQGTATGANADVGGLVGQYDGVNIAGVGVYNSIFTGGITTACTAGVSCNVGPVIGKLNSFPATTVQSVVYPNTLNTLSTKNSSLYGQAQDPLSFMSMTPGWTDGSSDLMVNFPLSLWEFSNTSLPRLVSEPDS